MDVVSESRVELECILRMSALFIDSLAGILTASISRVNQGFVAAIATPSKECLSQVSRHVSQQHGIKLSLTTEA